MGGYFFLATPCIFLKSTDFYISILSCAGVEATMARNLMVHLIRHKFLESGFSYLFLLVTSSGEFDHFGYFTTSLSLRSDN